ncbi:MAG: flagellar hook-associated protein FlgL, partial [Desulfovibrionaceae bacterium]|nr:flagellar hook-associated protein FlgL [Desulfovibrionaceae bacterium]
MIRVSQRQMYSNFLFNMNNSLSAYMESHLQSATQKKVNRPSDDPYGTAQIMASNTQLYAIKQYNDNLSMAKGWLMQAESTMDQVQTGMSRIIEILEQASTGTLSSTQREILGNELRTIMEQMISYANVKFNGRYIFGGQKTDASPYSLIMGATSRDPGLEQARFVVEGQVSQSAIIRFMDDGDSGPPPVLPAFQYTLDKGATWIDSTPADWSGSGAVGDVLNPYGDPYKIRLGVSGVSVTLLGPDAATPFDLSWISASDPNDVHENGSWIYVHPAAQYNGDT